MGGPTACLTLNTSDWPSDAAVCSLSAVLEDGPLLPRYFLSSKACAGILRRAAKRGKDLPPALRRALEAVAASAQTPSATAPSWEAQLNANNLSTILPLVLPTGYSLRASTEKAELFNILAIGGDF